MGVQRRLSPTLAAIRATLEPWVPVFLSWERDRSGFSTAAPGSGDPQQTHVHSATRSPASPAALSVRKGGTPRSGRVPSNPAWEVQRPGNGASRRGWGHGHHNKRTCAQPRAAHLEEPPRGARPLSPLRRREQLRGRHLLEEVDKDIEKVPPGHPHTLPD